MTIRNYIILSIFCFLIYLSNILDVLITKNLTLGTCISGWITSIMWLIFYTVDRCKRLKNLEKEEKDGRF